MGRPPVSWNSANFPAHVKEHVVSAAAERPSRQSLWAPATGAGGRSVSRSYVIGRAVRRAFALRFFSRVVMFVKMS